MFNVDDPYLEDEVRDGFYIPSISKRAFAAELSLLYELNRICEKYNLKYFADWGTFLGAIRHRGYIPWDDDLDVCMHRNDVEKLLEVADKELPDGFEIHSFENNDYSWKFIYNMVNAERMCFTPEYLKTHYNFPYIAAIDIYILDNLSDDEEYENKRHSDVKFILDVADLTTDENKNTPQYIKALSSVERLRDIRIDRNLPVVEIKRILYKTVQNILKEQNYHETEYLVQMIPWGIYHNRKIHRSYYEKSIQVPFENVSISVSLKYYSLLLNHKYGRFWEIKMGVGGHGYPYFNAQKAELGTDMDYIPQYRFNVDQVIKNSSGKKASIKAIAGDYSDYLKISYNDILEQIDDIIGAGDTSGVVNDKIVNILTECQENAIQFGTLVEKTKGENTNTVAGLEKYCEDLFEILQSVSHEFVEREFKSRIDNILSNIKTEILDRRMVVFLPFKSKYFNSFRPFYEAEISRTDTDVYVVPLPYYYKEYNGVFKEEAQYDLSAYPEDISCMDYTQLNLGLIYPDVIYIQNPYDEFNMCYSVPNYFYASNLKNLTDELIYVPWFKTSDFDADNYPQNYNMQYYCTVPGVVLSDTVYVSSEIIRERYIEKLTEFSSLEYKSVWEEKIKVTPYNSSYYHTVKNNNVDDSKINQKKYLCFYTSPSYLLEMGDKYFDKINNCIETFEEAKDNIKVIWRIEPYELDIIKSNDTYIYDKLMNIIDELSGQNFISVDYETSETELTDKCAAFYGDGSYLSKDFVIAGKPVMIMNIDI